MEREKHSYQNLIVQVSRKIFISIDAAGEALICGFVTWLFLSIFPNILCTEYSGICGTQENEKWRTEELKKMEVQTRVLERALGSKVQRVITFTQNLDALLPQVLEYGIPCRKNRTSMLNMFGDRQVK